MIGKTTKFAAHFTKLENNFTAVEEGSVSIKLIGKKGQPSFKANSPKSSGIFSLKLKPINTGKYKLVFYINTKTYADTISIDDVVVYPNSKTAEADNKGSKVDDIIYLKEQAWKIDFANKKVVKLPFAEIIKTTGHILPAQGDEVIITAKSDGIITFGGNKKLVGSSVNANETLFLITGGGLSENNIDSDFKDAKAVYEKSKADFNRDEKLFKTGVIPEQKFQQTELNYKNAQIAFNTIAEITLQMVKKLPLR